MQTYFYQLIRAFRKFIDDLQQSPKEYLRLILGIIVGLISGILLISGFYGLLDELQDKELGPFDDLVSSVIHGLRSPGLTKAMILITELGDRNAYIIFGLGLFIFFYIRYKSLIFPFQTSLVLLIAGGLNRWLKALIDRPRPSEGYLLEVGSLSFPSGHAMSSIAFYGFLIYLSWRLTARNPVLRWCLSIGLLLLILAIGFSRVYLGVHYPSDVLAGYAAGGACLAIFITIFTYVRYRYARKGAEPQLTEKEQQG